MKTIEIESPSLPKEIREFRQQARFVVIAGEFTSEMMDYPAAVLTANAMEGLPSVAFVVEPEPEPLDYREPLPSILSRRKRKQNDI